MLIPFENLWLPTLCTVILGTWLLRRFANFSRGSAFSIAVVKVAIPLLYFAYFYDGQWNTLDDIAYFRYADLLLADGWNPLNILLTARGRGQLIDVAGSTQFLYYWWNLLALYIFGPFYSSPVFLNVMGTFVSGILMFDMARVSGCTERYAKWLAAFFLLHWDILVWSSFVNLKDALILMLTVASVYSGMQFVRTKVLRYLVWLSLSIFAFLWVRFYIPVFLLSAVAVWLVFLIKGWQKVFWVLLAVAGIYIVLPPDFFDAVRQYSTGDWIIGSIRVCLSPQPWSLTREYTFLLLPSVLHWSFFVPAFLTGIHLAYRNRVFRLGAIYFLMLVAVYATIPSQAGTRHRLQAMWVLIWAQFDFLWLIASSKTQRVAALMKVSPVGASAALADRKT